MQTLNWIGKDAVVKHHKDVPYGLREPVAELSCRLPGGNILAVEYKGADRWKEAEDDRLIGGLWAELSGGRCRFVMVTNRQWDGIDALL